MEVEDMRIFRDLLRAVLWSLRPSARGRRWGAYLLTTVVAVSIAWSARRHEAAAGVIRDAGTPATAIIERLIDRAEHVGQLWREVEEYYEQEIAPIERVLVRYRADPELARRIAIALVTE